jgi:hypothetical protein
MSSGELEVLNPTRSVEDRLSELELENSRLQRLVVELLLKNQYLREALLFHRRVIGIHDQSRNSPYSESL